MEIPINHKLLKWARKASNLSLEESAKRANISDLKPRGKKTGVSGWKRIELWEKGIEQPSFNQLKSLARAYRRPILTFFLEAPPQKDTSLKDYRTIGNKLIDESINTPEFSALIRQIEALHRNVRYILEESGSLPLSFVGSATINQKPSDLVANIRNELRFTFEGQQRISNKKELFRTIREKCETSGIYVIKKGDLGNYHTRINPQTFKGLAISDPLAPLIAVNPNDWKSAMLFTLIHELAHIWLGSSAITNIDSFDVNHHEQIKIEAFCDRIAAEFLVPENYLRKKWGDIKRKGLREAIDELSRQMNVSVIVIARRMVDFQFIDRKVYWDFYESHMEFLRREKDKLRAQQEDVRLPASVKAKSQFGRKLIRTVINAAFEGKISDLDASQILKIKIDKFQELSSVSV